ncbi:MAG: YciI family protein [Propionibacterium freudenreichii]
MAFFAVNYTYDPAKDVEAVRPRHREFLRGLAERGVLRASGPFPGLEPQRALLIFEADSAEEVATLLDQDPVHTEDILKVREILEWNPVIGIFAV